MRWMMESIEGEYRRYKSLGDGAMEQLSEVQLSERRDVGGNSIATLVWHLSGNLTSRFTDFPAADGEKPWRDRDEEFLPRVAGRTELREKWEQGWRVLFHALAGIQDEQLRDTVTIRGVPLSMVEALHRSLAHASYHVGQMVFLAKELRGPDWRTLSIPPGGSSAYNRNPVGEKPPKRSPS
jgi:hypothetical protein